MTRHCIGTVAEFTVNVDTKPGRDDEAITVDNDDGTDLYMSVATARRFGAMLVIAADRAEGKTL